MALKIIVAATLDNVIGLKNSLPFRLADDMKRFKEKTVGRAIVCGRTTYFSLPARFRPLPDRENIVLTHDPTELDGEMVTVVTDFKKVLERARSEEIWIVGGAEVYRQALPFVQEIHLTRVQAIVPGDAYFHGLDSAEWSLVDQERRAADDRNRYNFTWETWRRL